MGSRAEKGRDIHLDDCDCISSHAASEAQPLGSFQKNYN